VGEVSQAAEAFGIHPGMRLGEALARCPRLALVPPDPVAVADDWERIVSALEAIGAAVEAGRPGLACFDARGLRRLHGGSLDGIVTAVRAALRRPARIGAGPTRFCAQAAAARARSRRAAIIPGAAQLAGEPVALLRGRQRGDLARRLATGALGRSVERGVDHREVGEQQLGADGREVLGGRGVGAEAPDDDRERVDLSQGRDALGGRRPARNVDEPGLGLDDPARALEVREHADALVGDRDDGLVGSTAGGADPGQRREQRRLPRIRQADEADVLHRARLAAASSAPAP
jgi:hypothetical protein